MSRGRGREREGEADSLLIREPNAGLNPRTPGSRPEPKADTQPLSHSGAPLEALSNPWYREGNPNYKVVFYVKRQISNQGVGGNWKLKGGI